MVMHLTQCCCGCTLKTGSVIIGVLGAIGSLISLVFCIIMASAATEVKNQTFTQDSHLDLSDEDLKNLNDVNKEAMKGAIIFLVVYAIICAVQLILNIMLIFGASSEKPRLIKPWIVAAVISAVVGGVLYIVQIIMLLVAGAIMAALLGFVICAVVMCVVVYFILVVNSLHTELTSQQFPPKI